MRIFSYIFSFVLLFSMTINLDSETVSARSSRHGRYSGYCGEKLCSQCNTYMMCPRVGGGCNPRGHGVCHNCGYVENSNKSNCDGVPDND